MRWRVKAVAIAAVTAVVTVAGCAQTITGTAQRANPAVPDPERSYGYVDNRCGLLEDSSIQEMLGAQSVVRPYSGAVCQYVLERDSGPDAGSATTIDVVYSWFETGNLDREQTLAQQRGANGHRQGHRTTPGVPGPPRYERSGLFGHHRGRPRRAELVGADAR